MKNKLIAIVAVGLIILASTVAQAADWQNSITRIDLMGRIQVYSFKNFEAYYIASADGH